MSSVTYFSKMEPVSQYERSSAIPLASKVGKVSALVALVAAAALWAIGVTGVILAGVVSVGCTGALAFLVAHFAVKYFGYHLLFNDVYKGTWVHDTEVAPYDEFQLDQHFINDYITRPGTLYIEGESFSDKRAMVEHLAHFCKDATILRFVTAVVAQTGFADSVYYSHQKFPDQVITAHNPHWFCEIAYDAKGYIHVSHQQEIRINFHQVALMKQTRTFDPAALTDKGGEYTISLSLSV